MNHDYMTRLRETLSNQPLTREITRRIHGDNFSILLRENAGFRYRALFDWSIVQHAARETGVIIPSTLIYQFGMESLQWAFIDRKNKDNRSSILLTGKPSIEGDFLNDSMTIDEACVTVAIENRITLSNRNEKRVSSLYLGAAGIIGSSIIAVNYNLEEEGHLTDLNISIPDEELPEQFNFQRDAYRSDEVGISSGSVRFPLLTPVPSDKFHLHRTAGLITCAMVDAAGHRQVLVFEFDKEGNVFGDLAKKLITERKDLVKFAIDGRGYLLEQKDGIVTVKSKEDFAKAKGVPFWEISVPEFLPKA